MRELKGRSLWVFRIIASMYTIFQMYTAGFGLLPLLRQRSTHVAFGLILCFLVLPDRKAAKTKRMIPFYDLAFIALIIISTINIWVHYLSYLTYRIEFSSFEYFLAITTIIMVLECGRRSTGWVFPFLTVLMIAYALLGRQMPEMLAHAGMKWDYVLRVLYQGELGMWGYVVGLSATIVAMFIIFGAILQYTGGGETFISLATLIAGRFRGGPALVAVISSAMMGTVSGSAVGNVATTGSFTIPAMKRMGYRPYFAGAVETAASTGGQFTPPIMGAGAFIMAEILNIPYFSVCVAAILPAILYYFGIFTSIWLEAKKMRLLPVPKDEIPRTHDVITWQRLGPFVVPISVLIYLLVEGYTVYRAGFYACILAIGIFLFVDFSPRNILKRLGVVAISLERAGMALVEIVPLLVCANIVVSLIDMTGLGIKISEVMMGMAGVSLILALVLAAIVTILLGMGVPTTAAYVIGVSVAGVGLIKLGINPLAAHMFCFYFACLSGMTPPVCVAAFTAAGIAGGPWMPIALTSIRLGAVAFIIPFFLIYNPSLMLGGNFIEVIFPAITAMIGVILLATGLCGYFKGALKLSSRVFFICGGILLIYPGFITDTIAAVMIISGLIIEASMKQIKNNG